MRMRRSDYAATQTPTWADHCHAGHVQMLQEPRQGHRTFEPAGAAVSATANRTLIGRRHRQAIAKQID